MCRGDCPCRSQHEVRGETDKESIEDAERGRDRPQLVDPRRTEAVQALDPEEESSGASMNAGVPEQNVNENDAPKLVLPDNILDIRNAELAVRLVTGTLEPPFGHLDVLPAQKAEIGLIRRAGDHEVSQDTNGNSDDRADYVHPAPPV